MASRTIVKPTMVVTNANKDSYVCPAIASPGCLIFNSDTGEYRRMVPGLRFDQCPFPGVGQASSTVTVPGSDNSVMFGVAGALTADATFQFSATSKGVTSGVFAGAVASIAGVAGSWAPPLAANRVSALVASVSDNVTVTIPSGVTGLRSGYRYVFEIAFVNGTTTLKTVNFDTTAGQYSLVGFALPSPEILPGGSKTFVVATETAGSTWLVLGRDAEKVPLPLAAGLTPAADSIFFDYSVQRRLILPANTADTGTPRCRTAPSAQVVFTLNKLPPGDGQVEALVGTATIGAGNTWGTWAFPSGYQDLSHETRIIFRAPSNVYGLTGLVATLSALA